MPVRGANMFVAPHRDDLQRIVVLNPKGGCGKTSLSTNIAAYFALNGPMPALVDCDPQGASMRWLEKRPKNRAPIHGVPAYKQFVNVTRTWQLRVPDETRQLVVDTPAGLDGPQIHELVYDASNVIVPIMPSAIDIRYAARFIAELLLVAQLDRGQVDVGIVANRTRANTRSLAQLMRFLTSLKIPLIAMLRDSQNFVEAAGSGIGVCELPHHRARNDLDQLSAVFAWLERTRLRRKQERDSMQRPRQDSVVDQPTR